ncbi:hypothetical protein M440DRAFT_1342790 [Trichoderma longibrachiatum ATCC 18648]|uniref:PRISE-like Rossmann-fold domain-containing protein n=1 Tax=Trichoderma longibrachiatum ATCC 18648 TaxID=983965 RepID=A0A2T4BS79_TRILO|nr:hypothetical protein M440DRAFT_1342790 [Trichoderma longibrachiatum ATCC 18648]
MSSVSAIANRTALVFGASGITGWAIAREALTYPTATTFRRVIGVTNRPLDRVKAFLPDDSRLTLAHGVDLTASVDDVVAKLADIDGIEDVTDVYFAAYIQPAGTSDFAGFDILKEINVRILETAVEAVERVSKRLRFWTLQTGGKSYGFVHVPQLGFPKVPAKETAPRIPQPFRDQVFYYAQHDALQKLSAEKNWRFAEIRPDLVIGFVPGGGNAMNYVQALGIFLSFYAYREKDSSGGKKSLPYPGPPAAYNSHYTEIGQITLARAHIFASGLEGASNGEIYNVGDSPTTRGNNWAEKWASICDMFGLEGIPPEETASFSVAAYMAQHRDEWGNFETHHGLMHGIIQRTSWEFMDVLTSLPVFDRQYDLTKARAAGFESRSDVLKSYEEAFALMRAAKMIP